MLLLLLIDGLTVVVEIIVFHCGVVKRVLVVANKNKALVKSSAFDPRSGSLNLQEDSSLANAQN